MKNVWERLSKEINGESEGQAIATLPSKRTGNRVPSYMQKSEQQKAGVFFGLKTYSVREESVSDEVKIKEATYYIGKPHDRDGHVLVIGGAGSGKSSCIAIPTLETWEGTIFAIDIKGELSAHWNKMKIEKGKRSAKIINLSDEQGLYASYNPFQFLEHDGEDNLIQNAREIAHSIIPLSPNVSEPFWIQSAQHVLTAILLYGYGIGASFNTTMIRILTTPIWDLIDEIDKWVETSRITENTKVAMVGAKLHISQFTKIKNPSDNKMLTGISAELSNKVMVFATNLRIEEVFDVTENSIKWTDLESENIFMRIAEDKLGQWDGAITMMLTQLIRTLERRPDMYFQRTEKKELPPVLLLLDEFPRLGKMDAIQNAVSTLRSKGVTICIVIQSLAQLDKTYGTETRKIIVDNCQYKAILNITDPENQQIFSDMVGSIKINTKNYSEGHTRTSNYYEEDYSSSESETHSVSESREPVIYPHEFATLDKEMVLITPEGFCLVNKLPYYQKKSADGGFKLVTPEVIVVTRAVEVTEPKGFVMEAPPSSYFPEQKVGYIPSKHEK